MIDLFMVNPNHSSYVHQFEHCRGNQTHNDTITVASSSKKNLSRIKLIIQMLCLTTRTLHGILPFGCLSAYTVERPDIKRRTVKRRDQQFSTVPLSWTGRRTGFSPDPESKSASCSMSVVPVRTSITAPMEPTCVPFAVTHATPRATARETDLTRVLYTHTTPYNPAGWRAALEHCNLSDTFPNLIHDIIHGSPILFIYYSI